MGAVWPQLVLIAALVIVNAAFAGTELALVSLREGQLQRLEQRSATGAVLARLARQPNQFLATIQIGITLAGFLASAAAAVSLAEPLEEPLSFLGGAAGPGSVVIVTLLLSYLTLVFGELAPKRVAMQRAERWGLLMARPLDALSRVMRPVVWLLSRSTDLAVRLLGGDPTVQREEVTEEELREMVAIQETFTPVQRQIIDGAFEIAERRLDEILVPRADVMVIDADLDCAAALELLKQSSHSRAPVGYGRSLDQVVGIVHLRELIGRDGEPVTAAMIDVPRFPEAAKVLTAMRDLQQRGTQMALVVDEYGGTIGIVTVEDLVEELVGEIYDETDTDLGTIRYRDDGAVLLPGRFPVHDLARLDINLPEGDYATLAGLVLEYLGRFPVVGERLVVESVIIEVVEMDEHRIVDVALRTATVDGSVDDHLIEQVRAEADRADDAAE